MVGIIKRRQWILASVIIAAVIFTSAVIIGCNPTANGISFGAVSDQQGGVMALCQQGKQIYAQRMNDSGNLVWNNGGVLLNDRFTPAFLPWEQQINVVGDGQGGIIATWDDRSGLVNDAQDPSYFSSLPVYSQRLNANGITMWGSAVPTGNTQAVGDSLTKPVSDEQGGAIFVYDDFQVVDEALHNDFFYLQKLNSAGIPQWGTKGILVASTAPFHPTTPQEKSEGEKGTWTRDGPSYESFSIVSDTVGGVFVVWFERISAVDETVYAQHYSPDGKPQWTTTGIPIYEGSFITSDYVAFDGMDGIFITISINEGSSGGKLIAQRVSGEGDLLWSPNGVPLEENINDLGSIQMVPSGQGDLIIAWQEVYSGEKYTQGILQVVKLDSEGNTSWQKEPLPLTDPGNEISDLSLCNDDNSIFMSWRLSNIETHGLSGGTIMAARLDIGSGQIPWGGSVIKVFDNPDLKYQSSPQVVVDNAGGCIIVPAVGRNSSEGDMVYAQRLDANGNFLWNKGLKISQ